MLKLSPTHHSWIVPLLLVYRCHGCKDHCIWNNYFRRRPTRHGELDGIHAQMLSRVCEWFTHRLASASHSTVLETTRTSTHTHVPRNMPHDTSLILTHDSVTQAINGVSKLFAWQGRNRGLVNPAWSWVHCMTSVGSWIDIILIFSTTIRRDITSTHSADSVYKWACMCVCIYERVCACVCSVHAFSLACITWGLTAAVGFCEKVGSGGRCAEKIATFEAAECHHNCKPYVSFSPLRMRIFGWDLTQL